MGKYIAAALDGESDRDQQEASALAIAQVLGPMTDEAAAAFALAITSDSETMRNARFKRRLTPGDIFAFKRRGELAKMRLNQGGYYTLSEVRELCASLGLSPDRFTLAVKGEGLYVGRI